MSLSLAAPEFGQRKLYANPGCAVSEESEDIFPVIQRFCD